MKKLLSGFMIVLILLMSVIVMSGCGVKSELARPDTAFPRDYPIY